VGVEFDYSFPAPINREQDNAELTAKTAAAAALAAVGVWDPDDILEVVGLPPMDTIAAQGPEPGAAAPGAAANAGQPGEPATAQPDEAAMNRLMGITPSEDDMHERLRRVLANGHIPVATGGR